MLLRIFRRGVTLLTFLFLVQAVPAILEAEEAPRVMRAVKVQSPPKIDGKLDDDCWRLAEPTTGFTQLFPDDGKLATEQTIIKVLYDEENLYFGIECLDSQPQKIDARLIPRDSDPYPGDLIGIVLDTFHDHQNAYCFWTNPRGIRMDFRSYDDFARGWGGRDFSWDGVWQSEAQITDRGWTVEVAIPFKTLRFPRSKKQTWGVNIQRYQKTKAENTHWAPITRDDVGVLKVSKAGHLVGLEYLKQGLHIELLPYGTSRYNEKK
ncbi:MAG: carbohydrate binding family 9 domain-containing protein, partial [Candidatus Poribacteria bacterium]